MLRAFADLFHNFAPERNRTDRHRVVPRCPMEALHSESTGCGDSPPHRSHLASDRPSTQAFPYYVALRHAGTCFDMTVVGPARTLIDSRMIQSSTLGKKA